MTLAPEILTDRHIRSWGVTDADAVRSIRERLCAADSPEGAAIDAVDGAVWRNVASIFADSGLKREQALALVRLARLTGGLGEGTELFDDLDAEARAGLAARVEAACGKYRLPAQVRAEVPTQHIAVFNPARGALRHLRQLFRQVP